MRIERIRNEYVRGTAQAVRFVKDARLEWHLDVQRRDVRYVEGRMLRMEQSSSKRRAKKMFNQCGAGEHVDDWCDKDDGEVRLK